jgi:hypothetical protein
MSAWIAAAWLLSAMRLSLSAQLIGSSPGGRAHVAGLVPSSARSPRARGSLQPPRWSSCPARADGAPVGGHWRRAAHRSQPAVLLLGPRWAPVRRGETLEPEGVGGADPTIGKVRQLPAAPRTCSPARRSPEQLPRVRVVDHADLTERGHYHGQPVGVPKLIVAVRRPGRVPLRALRDEQLGGLWRARGRSQGPPAFELAADLVGVLPGTVHDLAAHGLGLRSAVRTAVGGHRWGHA